MSWVSKYKRLIQKSGLLASAENGNTPTRIARIHTERSENKIEIGYMMDHPRMPEEYAGGGMDFAKSEGRGAPFYFTIPQQGM